MTGRYVSFHDSVGQEMEKWIAHHNARALEHESLGHPSDYAEGSRRKARKWEAELEAHRNMSIVNDPVSQIILDELSKMVAEAIFNGVDRGQPSGISGLATVEQRT